MCDGIAPIGHRVQAGSTLLDEKLPEWRKRIDVATLDMAANQDSLFGQLFGGWNQGLEALEFPKTPWEPGIAAIPFGFELCTKMPVSEYVPLTDAWRRVILDDQQASQPEQREG